MGELIYDGRTVFFHSMNDEALVPALYDSIERMVAALQFTSFAWEARRASAVGNRQPGCAGATAGCLVPVA